jgi:hypothetical protein
MWFMFTAVLGTRVELTSSPGQRAASSLGMTLGWTLLEDTSAAGVVAKPGLIASSERCVLPGLVMTVSDDASGDAVVVAGLTY